MRDTLGGRPFEAKKQGDKHILSFFPMMDGVKNPDKVIFRLSLSKADLKKLEKILG